MSSYIRAIKDEATWLSLNVHLRCTKEFGESEHRWRVQRGDHDRRTSGQEKREGDPSRGDINWRDCTRSQVEKVACRGVRWPHGR